GLGIRADAERIAAVHLEHRRDVGEYARDLEVRAAHRSVPRRLRNAFSSITATPSRAASVSFEPAPGPATTSVTFLLTLEAIVAPASSARRCASGRGMLSSVPVNTIVSPANGCGPFARFSCTGLTPAAFRRSSTLRFRALWKKSCTDWATSGPI